jgi:hypothetical protein
VIHILLAFLLLVAVLGVLLSAPPGDATRGEKSLGVLYTVYGVTTIAYALIVQVADAASGYKAGIVFADYVILTYLCFFNRWFRNKIIGLYIRIQKE